MPVVDAHQHFWDLERNYHPWLCDEPPIAFRYGDYRAIRKSYLPSDFLADSARHDVRESVYVEAEWDPRDPVGEVRWIESVAKRHRFPHAVVAQAWLDREDVAEVLAAYDGYGRVRGIRHKPAAAASPRDVRPGAPGGMGDDRWRLGYALLAPHGLSFDLQTPWWHLDEALDLARTFPATQIILNHTGLPSDRTTSGLAGWRRALDGFADAPNVAVKISGLGQVGEPWSVEANREIVLDTIRIFGIERCMFASNFPVDKLVATYDTIFDGFKAMVSQFPHAEQRRLFCDNARRFYRLGA